MAYVENIASCFEYCLCLREGVHICNCTDKPDLTMDALVTHVNSLLGRYPIIRLRLPFSIGLLISGIYDFVAKLTNKKLPISAIRVKKFCADSVYESKIGSTSFVAPAPLIEGLEKTIQIDFNECKLIDYPIYLEKFCTLY